jgi:hypothetical protein
LTPLASRGDQRVRKTGERPNGRTSTGERTNGVCFLCCEKIFPRKTLTQFRWAHQIWWIVAVLFNVPGIILVAQQSESETLFAYLSLANLTTTILVRNELLLTFLYWSFAYVPCFKFQLHRMLHSIGGLHVGAGIATNACIFVYLVSLFRTPFNGTLPEWAMRVTVLIIAVGLTFMVATSISPVRRRYHDTWEHIHRYVGWFSLLNLVLHVIAKGATATHWAIFYTPLPYLTIICLTSVFYIWFTVRRVAIITISGDNITIIKFPRRPTMKDGIVARVSTNLL